MAAVGVRREASSALLVLAGVVVASLLVGVLWGWLAPSEQLLVVEPERGSSLTGESMHRFDALALFVCAGAVTGLLTAVAAWRWRAVRGPLLLLGVVSGSLIGAYGMAWAGELVSEVRYPRPDNPAVGQIVTLPAELDTALGLLAQPLVASLVLLFLAVLSPTEDLGTGYSGPFGQSRPVETYTPGPAGPVDPFAIPYGTYGGGTDPRSHHAH
ncbi:DUF2567 domain-containing protein [Nocardia puris]|uniref:Uncharacterized protein DUF2567 n=1 Tax=Nocardia puris TaxID=208602 RepID=A0A366DH01_9NOCA|nr:DUF2567 domain-containing protein [Nocardia puris]MBF6213168.1 DUF2567 domain-containing protein [Nocardia puris]MBF6370202.1 DUF2567 domain-containing protein [Nocardia puris]RBO89343.1 uncharacterized protein DUF2567 [Nocardia puris]